MDSMENFGDLFEPDAPEAESADSFDKGAWAVRKQQERNTAFEAIDAAGLKAATDPQFLEQYLDVQARFSRNSARNCLLIASTMPTATNLRSAKDWQDKGVFIKKGEKSLVLLKPGKPYTNAAGEVKTSYDTKRVFDVSQTTSREKSAPVIRHDARTLLKALLTQSPCPVKVDQAIYPKTGAAYHPESQTITVRTGMNAPQIFRWVAQEIVHARQDGEDYKRGDWNFRAYCASYLLCKQFGVPTEDFDQSRAKAEFADRNSGETVAELEKIRDATGDISRGMEQALGNHQQEHTAQSKHSR